MKNDDIHIKINKNGETEITFKIDENVKNEILSEQGISEDEIDTYTLLEILQKQLELHGIKMIYKKVGDFENGKFIIKIQKK